jgi:hypothetical protein
VGTAVIVRRNEEEVEVDLRGLRVESELRSNSDRSSYRSEFGLDSTRGVRVR